MNQNLIQAVRSGNENVISLLPPEVLISIIAEFPITEITRLCRLSKHINQILCQNQALWRHLFRRDISTHAIPPNDDYHSDYIQSISMAQLRPGVNITLT